jgi:thioredoxin reductase (NADPH)
MKGENKNSKTESYEVVILGGGPAGLTAAIYSARYHLNTLVIAQSFGGTANLAGEVENWPGFSGTGKELMDKMKEQSEKFGAKFLEKEISSVKKEGSFFVIETEGKKVKAKTIIVALGTEHRKLAVPGEKEFLGKGVSYCATCDGMFFRNKTVAVIGGADSAAKAALYLSEITKKVYVLYRKTEMRCEPISLKKLCEKDNVEIIYQSLPTKISGEKIVKSLEYLQTVGEKEEQKSISVDGVFIEIGSTPMTELVKNLGMQMESDYILTDKDSKTNVPGVFAAGDNTNTKFKQMIVAAGSGATAAKSAYDFLRFEWKE